MSIELAIRLYARRGCHCCELRRSLDDNRQFAILAQNARHLQDVSISLGSLREKCGSRSHQRGAGRAGLRLGQLATLLHLLRNDVLCDCNRYFARLTNSSRTACGAARACSMAPFVVSAFPAASHAVGADCFKSAKRSSGSAQSIGSLSAIRIRP